MPLCNMGAAKSAAWEKHVETAALDAPILAVWALAALAMLIEN